MEERRLEYSRVKQRTVELEMGLSGGGLDQLRGSQGTNPIREQASLSQGHVATLL